MAVFGIALACALISVASVAGQTQMDLTELEVSSPSDVAGYYMTIEGNFTAPFRPSFTGPYTLVLSSPEKACAPLTNADAVQGNAVLISRGDCEFYRKVMFASQAGASAVLIGDVAPGSGLVRMIAAPANRQPIPALFLRVNDAADLTKAVSRGATVVVGVPKSRYAVCGGSTALLQCPTGSVIDLHDPPTGLALGSLLSPVVQRMLLYGCDGSM
eukprot:Opistho-2@84452